MLRIAGFARLNGITFIGPKYQVTATHTGKGIIIKQKRVPKLFSFAAWPKKVPLLRGMWTFIEMLAHMVISGSKKAKTAFAALFLLGAYVEFWPKAEKIPVPKSSTLITENILILGNLLMMVVLIWALQGLFRYHAAEHMAINAYLSGKNLNLENIRESSRISSRCGTNLVVILYLIQIILIGFLHLHFFVYLDVLFTFAIAYEIFRLQLKPFIWLGTLAQKHIVTRKPENYHLIIGGMGLESLISLEETGEFPKQYTMKEHLSSD